MFPSVAIEIRDKVSGEDLFANGTYIMDSVSIYSAGWDEAHLQFQEEQNRTLIYFAPSQERYVCSIGSQLTFDVIIEKFIEEKRCYTSTKVNNVSVDSFEYESSSDEFLTVWNVIVWVN